MTTGLFWEMKGQTHGENFQHVTVRLKKNSIWKRRWGKLTLKPVRCDVGFMGSSYASGKDCWG